MSRPYKEENYTKYGTKVKYELELLGQIEERELIWHRDKESRTVHVLSGTGWKLQLDDKLPEKPRLLHKNTRSKINLSPCLKR